MSETPKRTFCSACGRTDIWDACDERSCPVRAQPPVAPEASGPAALVERIEDRLFVAGQMDAQGHAAEKWKIGSGGVVLALSSRLLAEARLDLQALASASPAPACASCAEARRVLNPNCEQETVVGAIRNLQQAHLSEKGNCEEAEKRADAAEALQQSQAQEIARLTGALPIAEKVRAYADQEMRCTYGNCERCALMALAAELLAAFKGQQP